jgi:hypothetical protein
MQSLVSAHYVYNWYVRQFKDWYRVIMLNIVSVTMPAFLWSGIYGVYEVRDGRRQFILLHWPFLYIGCKLYSYILQLIIAWLFSSLVPLAFIVLYIFSFIIIFICNCFSWLITRGFSGWDHKVVDFLSTMNQCLSPHRLWFFIPHMATCNQQIALDFSVYSCFLYPVVVMIVW